MKRRVMVVGLVLAAAMTARADYLLVGTDRMTVSTELGASTMGYVYLCDQSRVDVVSGGRVNYLRTSNSSTAVVGGGSVYELDAQDYSTVSVSGGNVDWFNAGGSSTVTMAGGSVAWLDTYVFSTATVFSGIVGGLVTHDSSIAAVSGGSVDILDALGSSTVTISGGSAGQVQAWHSSTIVFNACDFVFGNGLTFDSSTHRVLGTGVFSGKWFDGTPWSLEIVRNDPTASILAVPEPMTLGMLAVGGMALLRRRES